MLHGEIWPEQRSVHFVFLPFGHGLLLPLSLQLLLGGSSGVLLTAQLNLEKRSVVIFKNETLCNLN